MPARRAIKCRCCGIDCETERPRHEINSLANDSSGRILRSVKCVFLPFFFSFFICSYRRGFERGILNSEENYGDRVLVSKSANFKIKFSKISKFVSLAKSFSATWKIRKAVENNF